MLYDIYRMGLDAIEARLPFRIATSIRDDPPTIYVSITNRTKDTPLIVKAVRTHFGRHDYTYSFLLAPVGTHKVEPGDTKDFFIPFTATTVQHRQYVKKPPADFDAYPSFDGPADLFRAIANGRPKSSWIEIDFNEFEERRFRRGRIASLFAQCIKTGKERANKKAG
jgi:hypothetical protein